MNRSLRVGLAVAIVGAGIWYGLHRKALTTTTRSIPAIPEFSEHPPPIPPQTLAPALPPSVSANATPDVIPEGNIRDHRAHSGTTPPPPLVDRISQPPNAPGVSSKITGALHAQLRAPVMDCGRQIPVEQRGVKPRIRTRLTVSIHGGVMRVDAAATELDDVVGAAVDPTRACVEHSVLGATIAAPDEADRERYEISMTYVVL